MKKNAVMLTLLMLATMVSPFAERPDFPNFDVNDTAKPSNTIPVITPWKVIPLDSEYAGGWCVASDLDGDNIPEVLAAKNMNVGDVHYTSAVAAFTLDGSVLWTWGDSKIGRKELHHDVACQVHDWDNDGQNEVVVLTNKYIVELDGRTGKVRKKISIKKDASDSITFADFTGDGHAETILVKDRYSNIWAYTRDGKMKWHVERPAGYRTAHQPRPMDIDGDGIDEVFAGYAMLNADGTERWVVKSETVGQEKGHLDCARVMTFGATAEETRIAITFCGAKNLAVIDGNGKIQWELPGYHLESIDVGRIMPGTEGLQLLVDYDHEPNGKSPIWVIDGSSGKPLGQLVTNSSRHHKLIDWDGDGLDEFVVARGRGLYDHTGQRIATLGTASQDGDHVHIGDMTGDGRPDILLTAQGQVYIYKNELGDKQENSTPGTGLNVTLY